jgi:phosphoglucosamine mutase
MSNLGLRRAMHDNEIGMLETAVGDRYVLEALAEHGASLGGEQSGHVIMTKFATTGDGILTGLHLAAEVARSGKTLAELAAVMTVYPQVLVNVRGVDHHALGTDAVIAGAVTAAQAALGDSGRVLLRPSGTEPMVRVMVEAELQETAERIAGELADVVRERLGA